MFIPFISELICKDLSNPLEALNETLKEWREFWTGKRARLSKQEQVGLFGELLTLSKLVENAGSKTVNNWGGPMDWLHDFESEKIDLEIKTTTTQPDTVHISKISQLAPMEGNKELHLIIIGLEKGEDLTLPKMVMKCRAQLTEAPEIEQFEKTLSASGYRDSDNHHYSSTYSVSFIKYIKLQTVLQSLSHLCDRNAGTVENIRYNLLTHAMDTVNLDSDLWLNFANLM